MRHSTDSIWARECAIPPRESLSGDRKTDVAVIGAGMAGILIARALQEAGRQVLVLEAGRIAGGQTRGTTAKITSQHGLIYTKLMRTMGEERARQYAMANEQAVGAFRRLIRNEGIDCGFEERDAYIYGSNEAELREEAETAARLGLPASFTKDISLPVPAAGAVRFAGQAQFDPLRFLRKISEDVTIYENTTVRTVEGGILLTDKGTVRAQHVVFACHYPFVNFPGLFFLRMHQERSYVLALGNAGPVGGMFLGSDSQTYSFRDYNGLLLLGGGGHRTGDDPAGGKYDLLREKARTWYPNSREVAHWSAQDGMTADGVPYIGRYAASRPRWYVAAGFRKWGMTTSMAAASILRGAICGTPDPNAAVFDPQRFGWASAAGVANELGHTLRSFGKRFFQIPKRRAEELAPGHGGVVLVNGKKGGAFREQNSALHAVEVRCPHLGCQLEWNPDEESWDCPCHGSRFGADGALLSGPAQTDLPRK